MTDPQIVRELVGGEWTTTVETGGGGGTGFTPARNVGQCVSSASLSGSPIADGIHYLPFATVSQGDATMVTFANYAGEPAVFPAVSGTYAWAAQIQATWDNFEATAPPTVTLVADADFYGAGGAVSVAFASDGAVPGSFNLLPTIIWWADSGSPTQVYLNTIDTGNHLTSVSAALWVQRIA